MKMLQLSLIMLLQKFLFNPSSINFQCEVQLNPGANSFNVQAFNDVETAQKTIVLNHIQRV